jgi:hypothetical protein
MIIKHYDTNAKPWYFNIPSDSKQTAFGFARVLESVSFWPIKPARKLDERSTRAKIARRVERVFLTLLTDLYPGSEEEFDSTPQDSRICLEQMGHKESQSAMNDCPVD